MGIPRWRPHLLPDEMNRRYRTSLIRAAIAELLCVSVFVFIGAGTVISTGGGGGEKGVGVFFHPPQSITGGRFGLGAHNLARGVSWAQGLLIEACLTFVLVFTIWGVAVDPRGPKQTAPLFIGLSVFVGVIFGVPLTGPSMNPARTFGTAAVANDWDHHWVYWVGPCLGGVIAAVTYNFLVLDTRYENAPSVAIQDADGNVIVDKNVDAV
eukprot:jgi/Mesen1/8239/ME000443S07394